MTKKLKIFSVFGTRPEAIKMAPFVLACEAADDIDHISCVTAQHREMLDSVLALFGIKPDYDLDVMVKGQDLFHITSKALMGLRDALKAERPDMVVVQGDTTTSFIGALAAYYEKIPVAHLEAGLRTHNKYSPFPEEGNRHLISCIADLHFAPTDFSKENLLKENTNPSTIHVVGNTVIDALLFIRDRVEANAPKEVIPFLKQLDDNKRLILVTGHRRENFGDGMEKVCEALKEIAEAHHDVEIVYAVHLNPNVQDPVNRIIGDVSNIHLLPPFGYESFVYMMNRSYLIVTDSGGIQEEAPSLAKPVIVTREVTERPEGVKAGVVTLVGTNKAGLIEKVTQLLSDEQEYNRMASIANPYGDGTSSQKILKTIRDYFSSEGLHLVKQAANQ